MRVLHKYAHMYEAKSLEHNNCCMYHLALTLERFCVLLADCSFVSILEMNGQCFPKETRVVCVTEAQCVFCKIKFNFLYLLFKLTTGYVGLKR
jgi:hypothetical protein